MACSASVGYLPDTSGYILSDSTHNERGGAVYQRFPFVPAHRGEGTTRPAGDRRHGVADVRQVAPHRPDDVGKNVRIVGTGHAESRVCRDHRPGDLTQVADFVKNAGLTLLTAAFQETYPVLNDTYVLDGYPLIPKAALTVSGTGTMTVAVSNTLTSYVGTRIARIWLTYADTSIEMIQLVFAVAQA